MGELQHEQLGRLGSRDLPRSPVNAVVEAQGSSVRFLVKVLDISITGARLHTRTQHLATGDWFRLELPLVEPQSAEVIWTDGLLAGCQFAHPLNPAVLQIVLKVLRRGDTESEDGTAGQSLSRAVWR